MTMRTSRLTLAALAFIATAPALPAVAQPLPDSDADLLDFRQSQADAPTGWVDPEIGNRRKCFDRPGRPEWVVKQPEGMEWRQDLIERYVGLQSMRRVVESGECTCENVYPDFNDFRADLSEILSQFPSNVDDFEEETRGEIRQMGRTVSRRRSQLAAEYGQTCRGF